jgi:hypothetical protein
VSRVVDLDALTGGGLEVVLGGEKYDLPGDIPMPTMLMFLELEQRLEETPADNVTEVAALLREMYDEILGLFQEANFETIDDPDEEGQQIEVPVQRIPISMRQVPVLIRQVQAIYNEGLGDAAPPPQAEPRTRSRKSSPRSKASSAKAKARK